MDIAFIILRAALGIGLLLLFCYSLSEQKRQDSLVIGGLRGSSANYAGGVDFESAVCPRSHSFRIPIVQLPGRIQQRIGRLRIWNLS